MAYLGRQQVTFENRPDAGKKLAQKLLEYKGKSAVVLAIPNGGVPVGFEVASALNADFDLIICRKVPIPLTPEAGFGAIADDGTMILNEELTKKLDLTREQIDFEASRVKAEIKRRSLLYRGERPLVKLSGKTIILVDDGLASGFTMLAAVESVRHRRPKEVIVAVPCASETAAQKVRKAADKLVAVSVGTAPKFAVADYYRRWYDLADDEVLRYLKRWRMRGLS